MTSYLPVYVGATGTTQRLVGLNGNSRVDVYTSAGAATEITNAPDLVPESGGKFPVLQTDEAPFLGAEARCEFHFIAGVGGSEPVGSDLIGSSPGAAGAGSRGLS